jgi:hypothetical protein
MGFFEVGKSALLDKVLIDSGQGYGASTRYVREGLSLVSHHDESSLDILDMKVVA